MNDPWDVKCVRQGHQYQSCMKLNGVPLLPPVLSRECRKEMQYYKLLAKEVEKRISILRPYVDNVSESSEDRTDAPELPECEHVFETPQENIKPDYNIVVDEVPPAEIDIIENSTYSPTNNKYKQSDKIEETNLIIDFSLDAIDLDEKDDTIFEQENILCCLPDADEIPERDCDFPKKPHKEKELLTDVETNRPRAQKQRIEDISSYDYNILSDNEYIPLQQDGPSSLSSKSFTGSLLDLHSESVKDAPKLIRQRSYTVLKPSPQLLAHLEVQSISTGVDVSSISMSESMSNLNMPNKKRRSWDLETAKVKWSSMAMELKKTNIVAKPANGTANNKNGKKASSATKSATQPLMQDKSKKNPNNKTPKSEPVHIKPKNVKSPVRNVPSDRTVTKEPTTPVTKNGVRTSPKSANGKKEDPTVGAKDSISTIISSSDDPATRVRELYEKLQKQQLMQMATLVEKQKREQQLLQQVFEEQNTVLLKQLKTVCPKASIEVKQAWGDLKDDTEIGPVSLSQLINSTPEKTPTSPVSKTLTETTNYINKCDNVLKKSRDITNSIKKQQPKVRSASNRTTKSIEQQLDGNRTRTHSPNHRITSRKLNYDTSASSDYESVVTPRDYEAMLTDRTNDTMADLNVTFPSDSSEEGRNNGSKGRKVAGVRSSSPVRAKNGLPSTDTAIRHLENSIHCSINAMCSGPVLTSKHLVLRPPTTQELVAASKIVAAAKGYLVRRLMATERVQATVQTIRDALLCALQLHQDREGIRGADVDLHRRLIQQITAACYSLHDTFVASSPAERCALIAADRARKLALATKQPTPRSVRRTEVMDQDSLFPIPQMYPISPLPMITYHEQETFSNDKALTRYMPSPRRRPWR